MLTDEDLGKIGKLVDDKLDIRFDKHSALMAEMMDSKLEARLGEHAKTITGTITETITKTIQEHADAVLEAVNEGFEDIERRMATKDDIERMFGNFETRLTERFDHRYVRRI